MTTTLVINEVVKGLNGRRGLMNTHWSVLHKLKRKYQLLFMSQTRNKHKGHVEVKMTRYYAGLPMDESDNLPSTAKLLMDAAKKAGIIADDSPQFLKLAEGYPKQVKVATRKEQRTEIVITDV